jgi:iron complex transport system substrate-binding protein
VKERSHGEFNRRLKFRVLALFILCAASLGQQARGTEEGRSFSVSRREGYTEVRDAAGRALALVDRGTPPPAGFAAERIVPRPVRRLAILGSFEPDIVAALGEAAAIIGLSRHEDWLIEEIQTGLAEGRIVSLGAEQAPDYERLKVLAPELILTSRLATLPMLDELKLSYALTYNRRENDLDNRLRFMDFIAALFGREDRMAAYRNDFRDWLGKLASTAAGRPRPKALWTVFHEKRVFVEPGNNWLAELMEAVGGDYLFADVAGDSTIEVSWERFIASGRSADVFVFYPNFAAPAVSKADLRARHPFLANFKALGPNGRIWAARPVFYQSAGHLAEIAEEIAALVHPEQYPGKRLKYFEELPENVPGS